MNEPTVYPVAEPKKSTPWKIIIPVGIAVILCCICLVVAGALAYLGIRGTGPLSMLATATYTKVPTRTFTPTMTANVVGDWDVYYDWDCTGSYNGPVVVTFAADQTLSLYEDGDYASGVWYLTGNSFEFVFDEDPYADYIGVLDYTFTYVEGTMSDNKGGSGCWYAYKR